MGVDEAKVDEYRRLLDLLGSTDPRDDTGKQVRRADFIHRLLYFGGTEAIQDAASFYLSNDRAERQAAAFVIQNALPHLSPRDRLHFTGSWYREWRNCGSWNDLAASRVRAFELRPDRAALQLATLHRDGRVREAALRALAELPLGSDWPFALVRLQDWVPQVAQAAREIVHKLLTPDAWEALMRHSDLVAALHFRSRPWLQAIYPQILEFMLSDPRIGGQWLRLSPRFRRMAARHIKIHRLRRGALSSVFAIDPDPYVNNVQVSLAKERSDWEALRRLARRPSPSVRVAALSALAEHDLQAARPTLIDALSDERWIVRNAARFYLDRMGGYAYREHYLRLLLKEPSAGALGGLGEVGTIEDIEVVEPFLTASSRLARLAAIRTILRLNPERLTAHVPKLLRDRSRIVRRATADFVAEDPSRLSVEERSRLFESANPAERRIGAALLFAISHWDAGPWILRACAHDDPLVRRSGERAFDPWVARSYRWIAPTPEQWERITACRPNARSELRSEFDRLATFVESRPQHRAEG